MNDNVKDLLEKVKVKSVAAAEYAGKKAGSASKKAGELWEHARLRMQIMDLKTELNALYRQMGELVYAAHVDPEADTSPIDTLLEQAEEKLGEITERHQRITELRKTMRCANPECGKPIEKGDTYCRGCGAAIEQLDDDEVEEQQ